MKPPFVFYFGMEPHCLNLTRVGLGSSLQPLPRGGIRGCTAACSFAFCFRQFQRLLITNIYMCDVWACVGMSVRSKGNSLSLSALEWIPGIESGHGDHTATAKPTEQSHLQASPVFLSRSCLTGVLSDPRRRSICSPKMTWAQTAAVKEKNPRPPSATEALGPGLWRIHRARSAKTPQLGHPKEVLGCWAGRATLGCESAGHTVGNPAG